MTDTEFAPNHICEMISYRLKDDGNYHLEAPNSLIDHLMEVELPQWMGGSLDLVENDNILEICSSDPALFPKFVAYFRKGDKDLVNQGDIHPKVLGSRRSEDEPRLRYPFHTLEQMGDWFIVENGNLSLVANYCSNYKKYMAPKKVFTTRKVDEGILVMLVYSPTALMPDSRRIKE